MRNKPSRVSAYTASPKLKSWRTSPVRPTNQLSPGEPEFGRRPSSGISITPWSSEPDQQLVRAGQQGRDQNAGRKNAREASALEDCDTKHSADVGPVARNRDRLHLRIRQPLLVTERFGLARMPVQHAATERSHPKVRLSSGESCDVHAAQRRVEDGYFLPVINQDAALPGSNQKMAGGQRQYGRDGARICVLRQNLPEVTAVEEQQTGLCSGDNQFLLARVGQHRGRNRDQRGRRQLLPNTIMFK